ncbi:MAG: dockerin type I repeat-containing protein [Prevotella sp.]|nr:dockerin type I repeat-containing protein [Prevotella sp.]
MVRRIAFWVITMVFGSWLNVNAKNITVDNFEIAPGETKLVAINFSNTSNVHVAFQADVQIPQGLTLNIDRCFLSDRFSNQDQELHIGEIETGVYRILTSSYDLTPFTGNSGPLIYLSITATQDYHGGSMAFSNMMSVDTTCKNYTFPEEVATSTISPYAWGDVNMDGNVNLSDLMLVVNEVVGKTTSYAERIDINGDNKINISDVATLTNILVAKE